MEFLQEKDYEPLLEFDTRELTSKQGKTYEVTMFKLYWQCVDALENTPYGTQYMIQHAEIWAEGSNGKYTVEMLFADRAWAMHDWYYNKCGYKHVAPTPPRPCPFVSQQTHKS